MKGQLDMNIQLLSVSNAGAAPDRRPSLRFYGFWLSQMGFVPGALVKAIPEPGGMEFTLHNEYIFSYSELDSLARKHGGKLIQVSYPDARKILGPALAASGRFVHHAGFDIGDALIARYDYGLIQVRKIPDTVKIILMTSVKNQDTGKPGQKAKLAGDWLSEFGFMPKTLVTTLSEPGRITLQPQEKIIKKSDDLRLIWPNPTRLLLVRETFHRDKQLPFITIPDYSLDKAGFAFGDVLLASCENSLITLQKLDFEKLGFLHRRGVHDEC
jgi:hypothetical protein